jgi:AbrB family looped-hinge helix DNA binding protein
MKLTQKGQVTVPKRMREQFGLGTGVEVEFEATEAGLLIRPRVDSQTERLRAGIRSIRGTADAGLNTETILEMTRG